MSVIKERYTNVKPTTHVSLLEQDCWKIDPSKIGVKIIAKGKMQLVTQIVVDVSKNVSNFHLSIYVILNSK